jgi:uncharacterized membrane protein
LATWVKLAFETASILVIATGGVATLGVFVTGLPAGSWLKAMRARLPRYLVLALELQLAADIVGTAISPTWEQLGKLAAIAVIRTFLNYFLVEELRETAERQN